MALTLLTLVLRLSGALLCLATFTIFLPRDAMAATNAWLGLAPLPDVPLTYYLARSGSAHYALRGVLYLLASTDLVRYRGLIRLLGWSNIAFGAVMIGVDVTAGMPRWWTLIEGPPIMLVGAIVLGLARRIPR